MAHHLKQLIVIFFYQNMDNNKNFFQSGGHDCMVP
jgi:hypothetical protein